MTNPEQIKDSIPCVMDSLKHKSEKCLKCWARKGDDCYSDIQGEDVKESAKTCEYLEE